MIIVLEGDRAKGSAWGFDCAVESCGTIDGTACLGRSCLIIWGKQSLIDEGNREQPDGDVPGDLRRVGDSVFGTVERGMKDSPGADAP